MFRNSSTESDNEDMLYSLRSTEDVILREEARESETECDRLCKFISLVYTLSVNMITWVLFDCKEMDKLKDLYKKELLYKNLFQRNI